MKSDWQMIENEKKIQNKKKDVRKQNCKQEYSKSIENH